MKKLAVILFVLLTTFGYSQNMSQAFEEGNKLYQDKEYRKALEKYQEISEQGYESTALYFNMGNAYFKSSQLAKAILYYERAQQLSPYDDDVKQNLKIAKEGTVDRFETVPQPLVRSAYLSILTALPPAGWAVVAITSLFLLLGGVFMYLFTSIRRPGFVLAVTGLLIGALSISLAYGHQGYLQKNRPAVITATSSYVKSGPSEKAEDVFILHEGTSATVTEDYEGWKKIKLPDGKVGWIESGDLVEV